MRVKAFSSLLGILALAGWGADVGNAQPANDMFANRITITGTNILVIGSSAGATAEFGEPYHAGVGGYASVWWSWTAPSTNGTVTIRTAGSSFDTLLGVYLGTSVSALAEVASNDDDPESAVLTSKVVFDTMPGQTYEIAVDGYYGASGDIDLYVQWTLPQPPPPPPPAPTWILPDPDGQTVYSTNFAGKVVIFDFWATWCGPCVSEIPDLISLQDEFRPDGLVIVGASLDDNPATVTTFLVTTPLNYQVVMGDAATEWAFGGIQYIPTTFIISRDNLIMKKYIGTQSRSTFEREIIPLLYGNTRLKARVTNNRLLLSWPTNVLNFTLESTASIRNPAWTAWATAPTVVNGMNIVQVPMNSTICFFRLRMPY